MTASKIYAARRYGRKKANVYKTGGLEIDDDRKEVMVDGEGVKLTPIEYHILLLLVKNQGRVFSINQIYENIWNEKQLLRIIQ